MVTLGVGGVGHRCRLEVGHTHILLHLERLAQPHLVTQQAATGVVQRRRYEMDPDLSRRSDSKGHLLSDVLDPQPCLLQYCPQCYSTVQCHFPSPVDIENLSILIDQLRPGRVEA